MPKDHWAYDAVTMLANDGVIEGYSDGNFNGDKLMNRYEMAEIVSKAMAKYDSAKPADKGAIKKLEKEFASELKDMDVRLTQVESDVAQLKKGQSSFKWWGDARTRYFKNMSMNDQAGHQGEKGRMQKRLRLGFLGDPAKNVGVEGRLEYEDSEFINKGASDKNHNFNTWDNSYNDQADFHVKKLALMWDHAGTKVTAGRATPTVGQGLIYWDNSFDGLVIEHKFGPKFDVLVGYGDSTAATWRQNNHWTWLGNISYKASPATTVTLSGMHTIGKNEYASTSIDVANNGYTVTLANGGTTTDGRTTVTATDNSKFWQENGKEMVWDDVTQKGYEVDINTKAPAITAQEKTTWNEDDWKLNQWALGFNTQLAPKWNLVAEYARNNVGSFKNRSAIWSRLTYGKQDWSKANTWMIYGEYINFGGGAVDSSGWAHHMNFAGGDGLGGHDAKGWGLGASYMLASNTNLEIDYYALKAHDRYIGAWNDGFDKYNSVLLAALTYSF